MAIFQVNFMNKQFDREFHYVVYREDDNPRDVAFNPAVETLRTAFRQFHHESVYLFEVRVRDPLVVRRTFIRRYTGAGQGNFTTSAVTAAKPDLTSSTVRVDMRGVTNSQRRLDIRGVSDDLVLRDPSNGFNQVTPFLSSAITQLREALIAGDWQIRVKLPPKNTEGDDDPVVGWRDVFSVEGAPNTNDKNTLFTTTEEHGFVKNDRVNVSTGPNIALCNLGGIWRVKEVPDTTTFVVAREYQSKEVLSTPTNMRCRKIVYVAEDIQDVLFHSFSSRQTGLARTGPRGSGRRNRCL